MRMRRRTGPVLRDLRPFCLPRMPSDRRGDNRHHVYRVQALRSRAQGVEQHATIRQAIYALAWVSEIFSDPVRAQGKDTAAMSDQTWPWPFVNDLIHAFDLNECEAGDLSDLAQRFQDVDVGQSNAWRVAIIAQLRARAYILSEEGSPMQPTWDALVSSHRILTNPHKT